MFNAGSRQSAADFSGAENHYDVRLRAPFEVPQHSPFCFLWHWLTRPRLPNSPRDRCADAPLICAPCRKEIRIGSAGFRPELLDAGVLEPTSGRILDYGRIVASLDENADEWARAIPC